MINAEANKKMATTHFEVIGVIGVDDKGIRHFRKDEIESNYHIFEGNLPV